MEKIFARSSSKVKDFHLFFLRIARIVSINLIVGVKVSLIVTSNSGIRKLVEQRLNVLRLWLQKTLPPLVNRKFELS